MRSKKIKTKVVLSMPDFIDNEAYEDLLEQFGIERLDDDTNEITLTVTHVTVE